MTIAWEDVPERARPQRRDPFINPDRRQAADPVWGHMGPTKRGIMKWIADRQGKARQLEAEAAAYLRSGDCDYFLHVRDEAEKLMKWIKAEGGAVGWTTVEDALRQELGG